MISNNNDLYATVQALSNELLEAGEQQCSAALNEALAISSVPGEVLGATRLQLQKLRASQAPALTGMKWRVAEALSYLNKIL